MKMSYFPGGSPDDFGASPCGGGGGGFMMCVFSSNLSVEPHRVVSLVRDRSEFVNCSRYQNY